MTRPSRRTVLCSTVAVVGLSAGCLGDDESPSDDDEPADSDDGSPDSTEDGPDAVGETIEELPDGLADGRTLAYQSPTSTERDITVLRDADTATDWLDDRESLRDAETVATFIDETDFETSLLVSLSAQAPTPCYEVVLESVDISTGVDAESGSPGGETETTDDTDGNTDTNEKLVLEAAVNETDDAEACAQVITTVGRLVRVTFESEPLTTVSATLVGHDGATYGVTIGSDSGSASASSTVESERGSGSESQSSDS